MIKNKYVPFLFIFIIIVTLASFFCGLKKVIYPIAYKEEISANAEKYNLQESLVYAIIKTESGFKNLAQSKKGAVGLMQIMPSTATWIASELNYEENYNLFKIETNIEFGCFYLSYLFRKYDDIDIVLFCYNAGEGHLKDVLKDNKLNFDGHYNLTNNYIKKVKKYLSKYEKLLQ